MYDALVLIEGVVSIRIKKSPKAIKLCRHGEVVHKTTLLQEFLNSEFTVIDGRPSKEYRYYSSIIVLAFILLQY